MFLNERTKNLTLVCGAALAAVLAGALEACASDDQAPSFDASGGAAANDGGGGSGAAPPLACSGVAGSCEQPGPSCCAGLTCLAATAPEYEGCRKRGPRLLDL